MSDTAPSPFHTARVIAGDIKLHHSLFAMPFAVLAAFMAAGPALDWSRFGGQLVLVVLAMLFARTLAMLSNRLLDREIDSRNPRTAGRALAGLSASIIVALRPEVRFRCDAVDFAGIAAAGFDAPRSDLPAASGDGFTASLSAFAN